MAVSIQHLAFPSERVIPDPSHSLIHIIFYGRHNPQINISDNYVFLVLLMIINNLFPYLIIVLYPRYSF